MSHSSSSLFCDDRIRFLDIDTFGWFYLICLSYWPYVRCVPSKIILIFQFVEWDYV